MTMFSFLFLYGMWMLHSNVLYGRFTIPLFTTFMDGMPADKIVPSKHDQAIRSIQTPKTFYHTRDNKVL